MGVDILGISRETALRWMPEDIDDDQDWIAFV